MADMQKQGNDMSTHVTLNTINVVVHAFLYVSLMFLESRILRFCIMCQHKCDPHVVWW